MVRNVLILKDRQVKPKNRIDWSKIGKVVTEVAEVYQFAKESQLDLLLVDEDRADITYAVAARIRRFNGLTEIWRLAPEEVHMNEDRFDFIDGYISSTQGTNGILKKVNQILGDKDLLNKFNIVGRSSQIKSVARTIDRIAPTDVPVLVVGPSGAGKELVARALHDNSSRKKNKFVAINCGAIAEGILESELFGHERGAFTGSIAKREGLFSKAESGTLFLDEIGETKPDMQVKLLRVLEDGTYYPVGSSSPRRADVRLVTATNRDLTEAIAERQFREDLYFRISVVKMVIPPLYERKGDIQPLIQHFWAGTDLNYSDAALDLLMKYDWPGNIRQLKNFCSRMMAFKSSGLVDTGDVENFIAEQHTAPSTLPVSTGKTAEEVGLELVYRAILSMGNEIRMLRNLITAHLPSEDSSMVQQAGDDSVEESSTMEEMEKRMIQKVLADTGGNRKEAAKKLGIGERTLYRKLNKYKLS